MPKESKAKGSARAAPYPKAKVAKKEEESAVRKNYGIGNCVQPKRDLTRFVKWPKYVRLQRQRRILYNRLKVPPALNQFTKTLDKSTATDLFKFVAKYQPETKLDKKMRLKKMAEEKKQAEEAGTKVEKKTKGRVPVVKFGINHIATLVESKRADLVIIAHDVDPVELVLWLPALCRKNGVPYCIVKNKSRLGRVVRMKTATAIALERQNVRHEDQGEFQKLIDAVKLNFNDRFDELRRQWGGGIMGAKSVARQTKKAKAIAKEEAKRLG